MGATNNPAIQNSSVWTLVKESLRGKEHDHTQGPVGRAIILLSIPMVLEMLMESVFALVDIFFVAKLGADAVAAVGITEALITVVYAVAVGVSVATTAMVARRVGEKNHEGAAIAAGQALWIGAAVAIVVGIIGLFYAEKLLHMMGAHESVVEGGSGYTRIMMSGSITIMFLFLMSAIFRGAGDPIIAMKALWLANGINIVLDPMLIFGIGPFPELGVTGAAVATNIGRACGVAYQLYALLSGQGRLQFQRKHFAPHRASLLRLLRLSVGGVLQHIIAVASWIFLMRIMTPFGSAAVAGYALAIRLFEFAFLPAWGLSNAAATLVGQNLGAQKPERAARSTWLSAKYNVAFCFLLSIGYFVFAEPLLSFFTQDPEILRFGLDALRFIAVPFAMFALGMVVMQALNGAGDTDTPTLINFVCFWLVQIPLAYWLAVHTGFETLGVYIAMGTAETLLAIIATYVFKRGKWKTRQV
ncbi:MAG: MATE family efflux transporter [Pseudomonadota bacterium]